MSAVIRNVAMLNVANDDFMLSVVMLSVVTRNVVAPDMVPKKFIALGARIDLNIQCGRVR